MSTVIITGSRSIRDPAIVAKAIEAAVTGPWGAYGTIAEVTELWHGGAKGVDILAAEWARSRGITARAFGVTPAEWEASRFLAGKRRNYRMMREAAKDGRHAVVVAVYDCVSGGTSNAVTFAAHFQLPVYVELVKVGGAR